MQPVLTITLNPALDVTTSLDRIEPLRKLRCGPPRLDPGGGGVNVSRAIRELGGDSRAFVAIGGYMGAELRALLEREGIACDYWPLAGETRFSLTVIEEDTARPFRFVLPGPSVTAQESAAMLAHLAVRIGGAPGYVVASGSLPPGVPLDFYARLARLSRERGARFIIDAHGEALRLAALERPHIIRLNHLEAQELLGGEADAAAHQLARQLIAHKLAEAAIVTIGERGAIVASAAGEIEIRPPPVTVRSGVGAGDSFVAALTYGLANDWSLDDSARYGVAAAAAAVTTEATELCKRDTVDAFYVAMGGQRRTGT